MTYKEKIIKELKKIMLRSQTDPTHITYWDGVIPEIIELFEIALQQVEQEVRKETLKELIDIFKDREPLEQYTTNVILLELKSRLSNLKEANK